MSSESGADTSLSSARELNVLLNSSLSEILGQELERLILSGELQPGERLNEIQLANRFGTSRGPIREASRVLASRGLVEIVPNRGVFVRQISLEEVSEIYELRAAVFGLVGRKLAQHPSQALIAELRTQLDEMDRAETDLAAYYPLNLGFHAKLVHASGNAILVEEYQKLVGKLYLCRVRGLTHSGSMHASNAEHRAMVDAIEAGEPLRAQEAFFQHVEHARLRFLSARDNPSPNPAT